MEHSDLLHIDSWVIVAPSPHGSEQLRGAKPLGSICAGKRSSALIQCKGDQEGGLLGENTTLTVKPPAEERIVQLSLLVAPPTRLRSLYTVSVPKCNC